MKITNDKGKFHSVVSPFQIQLLASLAMELGRFGRPVIVELKYCEPAAGFYVESNTGFPSPGMPFELRIKITSEDIVINIYPDGADAFESKGGHYIEGNWEIRCEKESFPSIEDMSNFFMDNISEKIFGGSAH